LLVCECVSEPMQGHCSPRPITAERERQRHTFDTYLLSDNEQTSKVEKKGKK
jgi:hypothetical protein